MTMATCWSAITTELHHPMANNVDKYKNPTRWYNSNVEERYKYVRKRLELYFDGLDDDDDFEWNIKDAVVGAVYFSKQAMNLVIQNRAEIKPQRTRPIIKEIYDNGSYKILCESGRLQCEGLGIDDFFKQSKFPQKINIEHVIPYKYYGKKLIELFQTNSLNLELFKHFMSCIYICIVTKEENSRFGGKLRSDMPQGWQWGDDPFARYKECGIKVWGQD